MMKNKAVTYVLIGFVLIIWGGIFYKVFASFFSSPAVRERPAVKENVKAVEAYREAPPFALSANYRDPFLGTVRAEGVTPKKKTGAPLKKAVVPAVPFDWSFIRYFGLIKNSSTGKKVALVSMHDQQRMLAEGEVWGDLKCLKNLKDSVFISYQERTTWIKR
jgi:hypothetical protein